MAEVSPAARRSPRRVRRRRALQAAARDAAALALGGFMSVAASVYADLPQASAGWTVVYGVAVMLILAVRGGYRFRLQTSPLDQLGQVLVATTLATTLLLTLRVAIEDDPILAQKLVRLWVFCTAFLTFGRIGAAVFAMRPDRPCLRTLVIGAGEVGQTVAARLRDHPEWGLKPIGFLDKEPRAGVALESVPVLGASWDLERVAQERGVEHVVIAFSTAPNDVLLGLIRSCRDLGVSISVVPRLFEEVSSRVEIDYLGGMPLMRVDQADPRGWQFDVKYALDRVLAAMALVLLSPLLALIALLVRRSSDGPVLFRQRRVGLDGRVFEMLKFRTMRLPEEEVEQDRAWAARSIGLATEEPLPADRCTGVGTFLRRTSLDELPQLINVLRGDMSLVGPRPERVGYVEHFTNRVYRYGDRHRVKSGLTGWAQVNGLRGETSLQDRVEWDNYYVENWTPWLDVKIVLLTLPALIGPSPERR